jgi:Tol biopolymer transport system component
VPETPSGAGYPFIDSSGTLLYASRSADGSYAIYRLPKAASRPSLVATRTRPGFAATSDGRYVVFTGSDSAFPLYRVSSDASGLVKLVDRAALTPAITGDSRTVLFGTLGAGVFRVPLDAGSPTKLSDHDVQRLAVSPDGQRLLFETEKPGTAGVCALPACPTTREIQLPAWVSWQWAPDGRSIAYVNPADQGNLWRQPLDGSAPSALTHISDAQILEFAWSAGGGQLAFSRGKKISDIVLIKGLR